MSITSLGAPAPPEGVTLPPGSAVKGALAGAASGGLSGASAGPWGAAAGAIAGAVKNLIKSNKMRKELDALDYKNKLRHQNKVNQLTTEGTAMLDADSAGTGYFTNMYSDFKSGGKVGCKGCGGMMKKGGELMSASSLPQEAIILIIKLGEDIGKMSSDDQEVKKKKKQSKEDGGEMPEMFQSGGRVSRGFNVSMNHSNSDRGFIVSFQSGGSIDKKDPEEEYKEWRELLPDNLKHTDDSLYDLKGAYFAGLRPKFDQETGLQKMASRDPKSGRVFKSEKHPTIKETVDEDLKLGYLMYKDSDGNLFSFKEGEAPEGMERFHLPSSFRDGGRMNIIPKGVLHAHKNKIGDKGIPVVIKEEGGSFKKVAEIERDEIIFSLEVTEELEKYADLMEDGTITDAELIEVGKMIQQEVKNNTVDMTKNMIV